MQFERKDLWEIERKCNEELKIKSLNKYWKRAYEDLKYAANVLDAHMARTESNK